MNLHIGLVVNKAKETNKARVVMKSDIKAGTLQQISLNGQSVLSTCMDLYYSIEK